LAAAFGTFFLTTTGSQSCDTGPPIPAMPLLFCSVLFSCFFWAMKIESLRTKFYKKKFLTKYMWRSQEFVLSLSL
jgi:hypothetical protein